MNKEIVTQNTKLINSKYNLTELELKFLLSIIAKIDSKKENEFKVYTFNKKELEEEIGFPNHKNSFYKTFARRIMSKPFDIEIEKDHWITFNWLSKFEYNKGEIKVRIDDDLKPYLLELKERFIKYNLRYIIPLKSAYSIRIYQLLKEYEKYGVRYFDVEELMNILQVPKSYQRYGLFKQKVLEQAHRELTEKTDITFDFEEDKKEWKKVIRLRFRIYKNHNKKQEEKAKEDDLSQYLKKTIYYNGFDWVIIYAERLERNEIKIQIIDDEKNLKQMELHESKLQLMVESYEKSHPRLIQE